MEPIEVDLAGDLSPQGDPMGKLLLALHQIQRSGSGRREASTRFYMNSTTRDKLAMRSAPPAPVPGWPDYKATPRDLLFGMPVFIDQGLDDDMVVAISENIDNPAMPVSALWKPKPVPPAPSRWSRVKRFFRRLLTAQRH